MDRADHGMHSHRLLEDQASDQPVGLAQIAQICHLQLRRRHATFGAPNGGYSRLGQTSRDHGVWRAGSDARSIAESERVLPYCPDRSADARSDSHVLGPGVLATGKRLVALQVGVGSLPVCHDRSRNRSQGRLQVNWPAGLRAWLLALPRRATSGC